MEKRDEQMHRSLETSILSSAWWTLGHKRTLISEVYFWIRLSDTSGEQGLAEKKIWTFISKLQVCLGCAISIIPQFLGPCSFHSSSRPSWLSFFRYSCFLHIQAYAASHLLEHSVCFSLHFCLTAVFLSCHRRQHINRWIEIYTHVYIARKSNCQSHVPGK